MSSKEFKPNLQCCEQIERARVLHSSRPLYARLYLQKLLGLSNNPPSGIRFRFAIYQTGQTSLENTKGPSDTITLSSLFNILDSFLPSTFPLLIVNQTLQKHLMPCSKRRNSLCKMQLDTYFPNSKAFYARKAKHPIPLHFTQLVCTGL